MDAKLGCLIILLGVVHKSQAQLTCDKSYCPHCYPSFVSSPPTPICLVAPAPSEIENCMQASQENIKFCGRCKPGYMLAEGNTKCVQTKIENCISGVVIGRNQHLCSICAFFHPSTDFRQCSIPIETPNCLFGGLSYDKLVEIRSKENRFALSLHRKVVTKMDPSFFQKIDGTSDASVNIALSERLQNFRTTCQTCLPGYSKYSDDPNNCQVECAQGCDLCSGSNRNKCLKCKEWLSYFEMGVSKEGYVECSKLAAINPWKIISFLLISCQFLN